MRAALRYIAEDELVGYAEGAERLVRALRSCGVAVEYRGLALGRDGVPCSLRRHSRDPYPDERAAPDAPTIARMVPPRIPQVREANRRGPLVWQTVWETDRLPRHWVRLLDAVDRVIVPTEWNRAVFAASGVTTPIAVVPHVACDPVPGDAGVPLDLPDDVVVFYTISQWVSRKQPAADLRAFLDAFTADDPVAFVIKTSPFTGSAESVDWAGSSPLVGTTMFEIAKIMRAHPRPPPVRVEVTDWPRARIAGLHTRGDCFVSLSHGEGWHFGAFDAAAYGNPVVTTGWGGPLEYLDPDASYLVGHDLEPVHHVDAVTYAPDQRWAVPRHDHAVALLREVAADLAAARARAEPQRERVLRDFAGPKVVATLGDEVPELLIPPPDGSLRA
jgi:glycosyltransferase involved in cell wall biosynthesis